MCSFKYKLWFLAILMQINNVKKETRAEKSVFCLILALVG